MTKGATMETTYTGPLKAGMLMRARKGDATLLVEERHIVHGEAQLRDMWLPVRPATPEGWALFVPDGPLPDTGKKDLKVGDVVAWGTDSWSGVAVVTGIRPQTYSPRALTKILAGHLPAGGEGFDLGSHIGHTAVLIFPAESAPEATPAPRKLVAGWNHSKMGWHCGGCGNWRGEFIKAPLDAPSVEGHRDRACAKCAEAMGVFAEPARYAVGVDWGNKDRSSELVIDRATGQVVSERTNSARCACTHAAHTGICTGPSAFGHEVCPCPVGRVATLECGFTLSKGEQHAGAVVLRKSKWDTGAVCDACWLGREARVAEKQADADYASREKPASEPPRPKVVISSSDVTP